MHKHRRAGALALILSLLAGLVAVTTAPASAEEEMTTVRINTGATAEYEDSSGNTWIPDWVDAGVGLIPIAWLLWDPFAHPPKNSATVSGISGTDDDPLYQSHTSGTSFGFASSFAYEIPVTPGCYTVTLHFAETFFLEEGERVFDVTIEGEQALTEFDVLDLVAPNTAFTQAFTVASDGTLRIAFAPATLMHEPFISGIEVVPALPLLCGDPSHVSSAFVPLAPERLFDTRASQGGDGPIAAEATLDVTIAGEGDVPAEATAVVLNLTAVNAAANGFVTAHPTGSQRPLAASLNMSPNDVTPNLVTVAIGDEGSVSFFASQEVNLVADLAGYYVPAEFADAGRFMPVEPARLFDTRPAQGGDGPIGAEDTFTFDVLDGEALPNTGVQAVVLTITAVNTAANGFVTAYPGDLEDAPLASQLTIRPGQNRSNLVIVPVGDDGTVAFFAKAQTNLVVDVTGYFTDDTAPLSTFGLFVPLSPQRSFDTRFPPAPEGIIVPGSEITVEIGDDITVPSTAIAVATNLTTVGALGTGFVTAYPAGEDLPGTASVVVYDPTLVRGTATITVLGAGAAISYYTLSGTNLVSDITGYFTSG